MMWYYIEYQLFGADAKYRVPTMQNLFWEIDTTSFSEIIFYPGFFAVTRRAVFILGAAW